jgi:hypothetical protein
MLIVSIPTEKTWIDYLVGIGSVATPLLVLLLTGIGWRVKKGLERRHALEEKLRNDRIEIYNRMLEPFVILLMSETAWQHDKQNKGKIKDDIAITKLLSLDYRRDAFKMALLGSDSVVLAYNELMQFFFNLGDDPVASRENLNIMLRLLGVFLLEIRKSMGNEATLLNPLQMLEWFMSDVRKITQT